MTMTKRQDGEAGGRCIYCHKPLPPAAGERVPRRHYCTCSIQRAAGHVVRPVSR